MQGSYNKNSKFCLCLCFESSIPEPGERVISVLKGVLGAIVEIRSFFGTTFASSGEPYYELQHNNDLKFQVWGNDRGFYC